MYRTAHIEVIGTIWMPATTAAYAYTMPVWPDSPEFTRENVQDWIDSHSGDFQSIEDFTARYNGQRIDWENPESECIYFDCMYGEEE